MGRKRKIHMYPTLDVSDNKREGSKRKKKRGINGWDQEKQDWQRGANGGGTRKNTSREVQTSRVWEPLKS